MIEHQVIESGVRRCGEFCLMEQK